MLVNAGALSYPPIEHELGSVAKVPPHVRLVAMTIMYEATSQPELGQRLVAHVVVNRWRVSGMHLEAVLFQKGQFAAWTDARKMSWLLSTALECEECFEVKGDFAQMVRIAEEVANGAPEPAGFEGVLFFDNPKFWPDTNGDPPWAPTKESLGCVADHCFWR